MKEQALERGAEPSTRDLTTTILLLLLFLLRIFFPLAFPPHYTTLHTRAHTHSLSPPLYIYATMHCIGDPLGGSISQVILYTTSTLPLHYFHIPSFLKVRTVRKVHKAHKENDGRTTGARRTRSAIAQEPSTETRNKDTGTDGYVSVSYASAGVGKENWVQEYL